MAGPFGSGSGQLLHPRSGSPRGSPFSGGRSWAHGSSDQDGDGAYRLTLSPLPPHVRASLLSFISLFQQVSSSPLEWWGHIWTINVVWRG